MSSKASKAGADKEAQRPSADEVRQAQLLQSVIPGRIVRPPRIFIYGIHGIGKSSFAADAPNPIFIPTEEGANELDVAKFPTATSYDAVLGYLRALYAEEHEYKTVVIDSVDWLEDYIRLELQQQHTEKELAFGRDTLMAEERLSNILSALNMLRNKRGMTAILIGHSEIKKFDSPLTEPYDRYQPKLQQRFSALLQEWADAVLFTTYEVTLKKQEGKGFDADKHRGVGQGERMLYTEEHPGYLAKNRYSMPKTMPLLDPAKGSPFAEFAQWVPYLRTEMGLAEPSGE